jgi:hypothetical protein
MSILSKNQNDLTVGESLVIASVTAVVAFAITTLPLGILNVWAHRQEKKNKTID